MANNNSKYNRILIDEEYHSPNGSLQQHPLTVEEYYDLMHHSHVEFENGGSGGGSSASDADVAELREAMAQLQNSLTALQQQVEQLSQTSQTAARTIEEVNAAVAELQQTQEAFSHYMNNTFEIGDWDATTPDTETNPD